MGNIQDLESQAKADISSAEAKLRAAADGVVLEAKSRLTAAHKTILVIAAVLAALVVWHFVL